MPPAPPRIIARKATRVDCWLALTPTPRLVPTQLWEYASDGFPTHVPDLRRLARGSHRIRRTQADDGARGRARAPTYLRLLRLRRPPAVARPRVRAPIVPARLPGPPT